MVTAVVWSVAHSGAAVQANLYDGSGDRVQQVAASSSFTYSYQGVSVLYETNATGPSTTTTKRFYAGGLQLAETVNSSVRYLHEDALGSVRLVTSPSMVTIFSSNFLPFGERFGWAGREETTYTGKQLDAATGLCYFDARYYDPSTGRFVTEDTYQGSLDDPATLNRYVYASDDPMRYTDPTGHYYVDASRGGGSVVPGACDAPPTWTCPPDTSGSQTTTTTSTTTATTTTSTSGEQTCQQGEVRDCLFAIPTPYQEAVDVVLGLGEATAFVTVGLYLGYSEAGGAVAAAFLLVGLFQSALPASVALLLAPEFSDIVSLATVAPTAFLAALMVATAAATNYVHEAGAGATPEDAVTAAMGPFNLVFSNLIKFGE